MENIVTVEGLEWSRGDGEGRLTTGGAGTGREQRRRAGVHWYAQCAQRTVLPVESWNIRVRVRFTFCSLGFSFTEYIHAGLGLGLGTFS